MRSVKGKRVLITGAAMGMGRLFAERAIAEQASAVVLWDVNEDALNDTLNELTDTRHRRHARSAATSSMSPTPARWPTPRPQCSTRSA